MGFRSLSGAAGGGTFSNFVLSVGQSGNTTYVLDEAYPAGAYTLSNSGDTTFDIYAIGTDGTEVGYTNGLKLETSADIKEIVILGAAANEVFTFEYSGTVTTASSRGDVASAGAFVTSVDSGSLPSVDDTVTVTGGNFAADVEAYFIDQSDNEVAAKTVVRNSSTEIVVTRPDSFSTADSPFTIKVVNPNVTLPTGSSAHLLSNAVTAGTNPVWQTTAAQAYSIGIANTITLVASDTEASDVDYAITAGSLPSGLTLDGETGVISGTPSGGADGDQAVFTVRATDAGGNFVDREFTFTANTAPTWTTTSSDIGNAGELELDAAASFQFVADGGTGGGSLTYSVQSGSLPTGTSLSSTGLLTGTPNTEETTTFTLRATDEAGLFADREFTIEVIVSPLYSFTSATFTPGGSEGRTGPTISQARSGVNNPSWASSYLNMSSDPGILLWTVPIAGQYEFTVAGAAGGIGGAQYAAGRGARMTGTFTLSKGQVLKLLVGQKGQDSDVNAGGGGGGSFVATDADAPLICAGGAAGSSYSTSTPMTAVNHGLSAIGDGTGGAAIGSGDMGGAGFFGDAVRPNQGITAKSFVNGGVGGSFEDIFGNFTGVGGFGGGGAGENSFPSGGGGGGYEGGDSGISQWVPEGNGQGGKSYNDGANQSNASGVNSGDGYISVTLL